MGLGYLLQWLRGSPAQAVTPALVDSLIAAIDQRLAAQLDAILHHPTFQALEREWRTVKFLVDRIDSRENIIVEMVNLSREDLDLDFQDSPEIGQSGLYRLAYVAEYGQFGGRPLALALAQYEIANSPEDYRTLSQAAEVGAAVHAPFLFPLSPKFFDLRSFADFDHTSEIGAIFQGQSRERWRALRAEEKSRYLALTWPGFLLRLPYTPTTVFTLNYEEKILDQATDCLWGPASAALALVMAESFALYRWCVNITYDHGGGILTGLLTRPSQALGSFSPRLCCQYQVSESLERTLAEEGIISLVARREPGQAFFLSANSPRRPQEFVGTPGPESEKAQAAALSHRLVTQLPYLMIVNRLAHYLKVLQRENIGSWKGATALETELNQWLNQFVTDMANPEPQARGRRPLRQAQARVLEEPGRPGWYRVSLTVRPHFKLLGASFDLSLTGRLEKMTWGV
jgi:type VI secretion system protein ImpC